ncbi:uncharacterized protein LOC121395660 [Xenopus laevis]|uniref:Uncharacterized protein LOC121395660 n=2 Tax=Xenopus laevis TaxID=8355 RepID=A0A1L8FPV1_XENLA|nr:uncharacterized protein LOC121395660 [Xenopus laevis]OCT73571.1 hypothetical protein XELAEV_18036550mg [Xenopus laevis]
MAALYLGAISFLLAVVHTLCDIRVDQAPFASGIIGSTVNLPCLLIDAEKQVTRAHPYWILQKPNQSEETLYPIKPGEETRVQLRNEDWKDMSIAFSNVQLSDTSKYICRISVLKGSESLYLAGNGTMLYVHGPIQMDFNSSHVMCKAQVQMTETVSLVWNFTFGDMLRGEQLSSKQQNPDGSFWISSHVPIQPQCTANGNMMLSCSLKNNKGYIIDEQSVEFPCPAPIEMNFNNTHVTCVSQIQEAQNISFVWDFGHWKRVHGPELSDQWWNADGSYWIKSSVTLHQERCTADGNVTLSCLLRNSLGYSFQNRSIEVPCTGGSKSKGHHPGLFFSLLLGSTLLILLLVLLLFYRRRQSRNPSQRLKVNAARPIPTEIYVPWIPVCSLIGGHVGKCNLQVCDTVCA